MTSNSSTTVFKGLDERYSHLCKQPISDLVYLSRVAPAEALEFFTIKYDKIERCLVPMSYYVAGGKLNGIGLNNLAELFIDMDKDFADNMGLDVCETEKDVISEIQKCFDKELKGKCKYYVYVNYSFEEPAGLLSITKDDKSEKCYRIRISSMYRARHVDVIGNIITQVADSLLVSTADKVILEIHEIPDYLGASIKYIESQGFVRENDTTNYVKKKELNNKSSSITDMARAMSKV